MALNFSPEDDTRNAGGVSHRTSHKQEISPEGGTRSVSPSGLFVGNDSFPVAHATGRRCVALRAESDPKTILNQTQIALEI